MDRSRTIAADPIGNWTAMKQRASYRTCILIADDEPLLRAELRDSLAALWPEAELVAEAADVYEALQLARALEPDVAFLDIRMPGLGGLELARTFGASAMYL
jgi:DNA-binding LytR/AlgR family response regulator